MRSADPVSVSRRPSRPTRRRPGERIRSENGRSSWRRIVSGAVWIARRAAIERPTCARSPVITPTIASASRSAVKIAPSPRIRVSESDT
jgi:hypothetical protein